MQNKILKIVNEGKQAYIYKTICPYDDHYRSSLWQEGWNSEEQQKKEILKAEFRRKNKKNKE